ncbi:MAG: repressor LexA [Kiritimatiellae bacterium]|nr:repressor LexA [Kiritimatiellia bacterium]
MPPRPLTTRQRSILEFIGATTRRTGYPPTVREIAARFRIASPRGVSDHLLALEKKGHIRRTAGKSRGIRVLTGIAGQIPIVGRIAAGTPITAVENVEGELDINGLFAGEGLFAVRVEGDSMTGCGICDGDYVIVRKADTVDDGAIGVAYIDGEATVKRIFRSGKGYRLQPENSNVAPIRVDAAGAEFRIGGAVVGVVRKM